MVNPTIFQIVGFQNSGKTTLIKKVINELAQLGLTAVTIKHHGHGGKPDFQEGKDSHQHLQAGAIATLVEGDGHLLLQAEKNHWSLEEKLELMSFFQPDFILIEGHKHESFPKGVLIRKKEDLSLLEQLQNIKVVFYWDQLNNNLETIQAFSIHDETGPQWLAHYLQRRSFD
ncbi:molybdopterin-guanine dinucleotide biosynthesis protein B [Robertmurraya yapensis]|uniref:Molybdopterin-guanine dinucleotide biosynthesis protein B n=2 Tax=Bacillus yapensis TaxID=2492960 RepID=A0A3S0KIY6_9BACI|nr:molybdopterin-guanine dinucleotide biosynthesis protein B [Bacillus yapensis]RTR31554.1 molybdopterin-guanine dinucleotide biosynthesis protein B [Bacillus yapensis]TKS95778.1 molybdopterin-guanine dinucleotide biosynthesis protein B [Bacillus yapensis]